MSRFLSEDLRALDPYVPGEQPRDRKYIKLNTNESPYPPPEAVLKAIRGQNMEDLRLYPDPDCTRLKETIADRYLLKPENIYVSNGSDDILNFAFMAFAGRGGRAVFPEISYGFYKVFAGRNGVRAVTVPLADDFSIRPSDYYNADGMVVIANPNAPTGLALEPEDICSILDANRNNVVLIDEAYVDFGARSSVSLTDSYDNLLVVRTFSKSRSMAGARLGFAMASPALIDDLNRIKFSTNPYDVNRLTQTAGIAAIESDSYFEKNCKAVAATRERVAAELKKRGFEVIPSVANFLFVRHPSVSGQDFYEKLREVGILVRHFGDEKIRDYNRITIGADREMDIFLEAADAIIKGGSDEKK